MLRERHRARPRLRQPCSPFGLAPREPLPAGWLPREASTRLLGGPLRSRHQPRGAPPAQARPAACLASNADREAVNSSLTRPIAAWASAASVSRAASSSASPFEFARALRAAACGRPSRPGEWPGRRVLAAAGQVRRGPRSTRLRFAVSPLPTEFELPAIRRRPGDGPSREPRVPRSVKRAVRLAAGVPHEIVRGPLPTRPSSSATCRCRLSSSACRLWRVASHCSFASLTDSSFRCSSAASAAAWLAKGAVFSNRSISFRSLRTSEINWRTRDRHRRWRRGARWGPAIGRCGQPAAGQERPYDRHRKGPPGGPPREALRIRLAQSKGGRPAPERRRGTARRSVVCSGPTSGPPCRWCLAEIRQCTDRTPRALSRNVQPGAEPIADWELPARTIWPSRAEPTIRRHRSPGGEP